MIGLPNAEKPVFRAYSIASPAWDDEIEFFSIKVPDGPLTSELQKIGRATRCSCARSRPARWCSTR